MKLLLAATVLALAVAFAWASGIPAGYGHGSYAFHGHYRPKGPCGNDGFYYKDHYSFVICSNGNAYEQPCAPGSRNSNYGHYRVGHKYYYRDFCDVNLVDYGFGAHRRYGGYGGYGHGGGYGRGGYGGYGGYGYH